MTTREDELVELCERLRDNAALLRVATPHISCAGRMEQAAQAITTLSSERDLLVERVTRAWEEVRDRLNKEHREGIISYRELKAGVNSAAVIRNAALTGVTGG